MPYFDETKTKGKLLNFKKEINVDNCTTFVILPDGLGQAIKKLNVFQLSYFICSGSLSFREMTLLLFPLS